MEWLGKSESATTLIQSCFLSLALTGLSEAPTSFNNAPLRFQPQPASISAGTPTSLQHTSDHSSRLVVYPRQIVHFRDCDLPSPRTTADDPSARQPGPFLRLTPGPHALGLLMEKEILRSPLRSPLGITFRAVKRISFSNYLRFNGRFTHIFQSLSSFDFAGGKISRRNRCSQSHQLTR